MTNRIQVLRSSTPGQVPTAGTRQPGELWTNFPDLQLGVIDTSKAAQKLIAVRFFSASANYATGDFVVQGGKLWFANSAVTAGAFNSTQWTQIAGLSDIPALYVLPVASTSVLGGVKIDGTTITIASGVISSAGLVTVSSVAPSPVQNGALWYDLVGGQLYTWVNDGSSSQWVIAVNQNLAGGVWLPLTGGMLSGAISGPSATFDNLSAPQAIGDNRIINGDMRIDQRGVGSSGGSTSASGYPVDRWPYTATQASKGTWQRSLAASGGQLQAAGFNYYFSFNSSSAYAVAASDTFYLTQVIEADMAGDLAWGAAGAQPVTLSFWALSSLTGTFGGSIRNYPIPPTRSYPFTFSLPAANTWTKIVITIPGDTAGAWVLSGNAAALGVAFSLGAGSTFSGPAGAWANGNYTSANGAVSVVGTNGATFFLTGVKLETGSVATPFNRQSLAKSMADCQRYFSTGAAIVGGWNGASGYIIDTFFYPVSMRAAPTVTPAYSTLINIVAGNISIGVISPNSFYSQGAGSSVGQMQWQIGWSASAEL